MDAQSQTFDARSQSLSQANHTFQSIYRMNHTPSVSYFIDDTVSCSGSAKYSKRKYRKKTQRYDDESSLMNPYQQSVMDDNISVSSSKFSIMLKSNQSGGYYQQLQKIKRYKDKNRDFFQKVIVEDIMKAQHIPQQSKRDVIELYRALCIFSSTNVLFYKRLYKHEQQFSLSHGKQANKIYQQSEEMLPRLIELMQGHLKVGAGIQNIRAFYNNNQLVKDQYSTLLHCLLRVVFSKVRDFIILRHPKLSFLLSTIKPGTARFNYSNAVSLSLLHADKEFSPSMYESYQKIVKVVYYYGGIQDIKLSDVEALFELLRQRNEQHLVPMRLQETKKSRMLGRRHNSEWMGYVPYVPYSEPQCDVDFQVQKPTGQQMFQKCGQYTTRNWTMKFQRYVLALYMKHQNFIDLKQIINTQYIDYIGRQFDLQQLRVKFDIAMKKLIFYLQLQLYYIIRRTNISKIQGYKVDFPTKKFLTINKNQKRALFCSQNAKNCRMLIIDYFLNNFERRSKSYKMSLINYRLSYISRIIDAIMTFLSTKIGESGILIESQLEKEDTYPLKLINNAYFSIIKSILKQILIQKSIRTYDQGEKIIKNPNTKRSIYNSAQIDKVFDDLRPDDIMEIQVLYLIRRNRSLIVKRNPKMFPNFKLTKTIQQGLVEEEWDTLMMILDRRGKIDLEDDDDDGGARFQKFQTTQGVDIEDEEALNIDKLKKCPLSQSSSVSKLPSGKKSNTSAYKLSSKYKQFSAANQTTNKNENKKTIYESETDQTRKKNREAYMKALRESQFVKTQLLILKVNEQKNGFKKYFK